VLVDITDCQPSHDGHCGGSDTSHFSNRQLSLSAVCYCPPIATLSLCGVQASGKCLIGQGGWKPCPKSGQMCTCGDKPFCASQKTYYGMDSCKTFCAHLDEMDIPE